MSLEVRRNGEAFSDSVSLDFADPERGACGLATISLRATAGQVVAAGAVLDADEEALSVRHHGELRAPADWGAIEVGGARARDDGERAAIRLDDGAHPLTIEAERVQGVALGDGSAFVDAAGLSVEAFSARVEAEWAAGEAPRRARSQGRLVRAVGEVDWSAIELVRVLVVALEDGSVLLAATARPRSAPGHGDEIGEAVMLGSDRSPSHWEEPLLSTEYDGSGQARRAGLELWSSPDDAPLRGAGTRIAATSSELFGAQVESVFLRWALDGERGTARYELMRPS